MSWMQKIDELVEKNREWASAREITPLERAFRVYSFREDIGHAFGGFAFWAPECVGIKDITTKEFYTDPQKMYYSQLYALNRWRHDLPAVFPDMYNVDIEACGCRLHYPENSVPVIAENVIKEKKDLAKLKIPNPETDGRIPYLLEIANMHREKLGDLFYVLVATQAPFSGIVGLRGYAKLVRDMRDDPDFVHAMLEYMLEVQIVFNKAIVDAGGTPPVPCDAWAAMPNISEEQIMEFVVPYTARFLDAIHQHAGAKGGWFMGWGYSLSNNWPRLIRILNASGTGTQFLFEEDILGRAGYRTVDIKQFKDICRSQNVVLSTSLMPQSIFSGPPERIKKLVHDWHKACAQDGGHCYYTTIPVGTPPEHVQAYVEALHECTYPATL